MDRDELAAWLRLTLTPGVGNDAARRLLAAFGLPQSVFDQPNAALRQVVSAPQANALQQIPEPLSALLERTSAWLEPTEPLGTEGIGRALLTLGDAGYPPSLLAMDDPPLMLYVMGQTHRLGVSGTQAHSTPPGWPERALAIVGSRNPTAQGRQNALQLSRALSGAGLTVVSGLALGIDAAAHEGALAAPGEQTQHLRTIAVVGTGIDRVYPRQHLTLAHQIARQGLIVSEYPLGTPPLPANFPKRNRLIAGLSQGTLVVEAALQSGSLITARLASEQGKEVFAVPGSIHAPQSRGGHALIRQGAKLVETAQDVLEELRWPVSADLKEGPDPAASPSAGTEWIAPDGRALLHALGGDPVGFDALQARTGLDTPTLQARLLELELDGHVARLPGGLFQRLVSA